eukprot:CAMPEP_0196659964 /NCGR_PEP_ID=MMETSP1086-20130531/37486_1 /TAXON_ID=77921 /ORGANISM="Cyanoptyche  gloeocystis , Strain SAG4.97" /LENGTH=33 /DNA_ID= /DNA_START= /DNA_END= /DNA_ORIENTATION=
MKRASCTPADRGSFCSASSSLNFGSQPPLLRSQ